MRTYVPQSVQPDQRLPNILERPSWRQNVQCGECSRKGWSSSWLSKDEDELAREKSLPTQRAGTVPPVHHGVPAPDTGPGT